MYAIQRMLTAALLLSALTVSQAQTASTSGSKSTQVTTASQAKAAAQKPSDDAEKLDINTATVDQLKSLPGIGDAYAAKIVGGRPYTAKNQLTTKGVIPQNTYNKIKDQIVAHHVAAKK